MAEISYRRHRFPPVIIQHAVWLYLRFTLSYRDVEELLAERGLDISYETIRRWVLKGRGVGAQLVGHEHVRSMTLVLEEGAAGEKVTLEREGVVNRGMHAEEALS